MENMQNSTIQELIHKTAMHAFEQGKTSAENNIIKMLSEEANASNNEEYKKAFMHFFARVKREQHG